MGDSQKIRTGVVFYLGSAKASSQSTSASEFCLQDRRAEIFSRFARSFGELVSMRLLLSYYYLQVLVTW